MGFKWFIEAKKSRNAKLVVVDPRFTRTAAVADVYSPIRAGTDIAYLFGLVRYALETGPFHEEYVRVHTSAPLIVTEKFGFEDGLFSGFDQEKGAYAKDTWAYELDAKGFAEADHTLQHPRCVFQLLKKHVDLRRTGRSPTRPAGSTWRKRSSSIHSLAESSAAR